MHPAGGLLTPMNGLCSLFMQCIRINHLKPVLFSLIIMLLGTGSAFSAVIDDSSLFVEAFTAYQKKDYLLTIEKIEALQQLYPATPLQDVALILLARAGLKAGDTELAAKSISRFNSEFGTSPLKATTEDELQQLGKRWRNGEKLSPILPLLAAARKTRSDLLAQEGPASQITGRDAFAAGTATQETVGSVIRLTGGELTVTVGQSGTIPFEIVNPGSHDETLVLEASAPPEYGAVLTTNGNPAEKTARVTVASAEPYKGSIAFHMPVNKVDGHRASISLRAYSDSDRLVFKEQEALVIVSAPLIRVVARPETQKPARGEQLSYHITLLNAGTLPARSLAVRLTLPDQIEFLAARGAPYRREGTETVIFAIDRLPSGKLEDFTLDVKVRESSTAGQELRFQVEVFQSILMLKETFASSAIVVQGK